MLYRDFSETSLPFPLDTGIEKHATDDQCASGKLQGFRDLAEQERRQDGCDHRSQSLEADTKDGEKYFRHHLKMLCPRMVEKTASSKPTTMVFSPIPKQIIPFHNRSDFRGVQ